MSLFGTLRHLFVPHHTNNHRPRVLHIEVLAAYVLGFALFNLGIRNFHRAMPDILGYATDIHIEQLFAATNAQRLSRGLPALMLNAKLSAAAASKAQDMFAKNYWAHNSPTGNTPWDFIIGAGYRYTVAGENLAKNFTTSSGVVDAWMGSPTHRDNITKPTYREIGFAVVNGVLNGEETTLVVQMFGASGDSFAVQPTKAPQLVQKALAVEEILAEGKKTAQATKAPEVIPDTIPTTSIGTEYRQDLFSGVTIRPAINIPTLTRDIVFVFAGVLIGVLVLDAWVVSRKRIVRIAGHNIAHFLFLSAIVISASLVNRGALL